MYLQHLILRNFRSFARADLSFGPRFNLIQGLNAQGKTTLLEAIYFLSSARSFRTLQISDLIKEGESFFYLEAHFVKEGISNQVKLSYDGKEKQLQINESRYTTFTPLLGSLPTVLYAPGDTSIISGVPMERRRFLDLHIAQNDPLYVHHLTRYFKAMKARNCLLKSKSEAAIDTWEQMMALSASYIVIKRQEVVLQLQEPLTTKMQELSNNQDSLQLCYQSPAAEQDLISFFVDQFKKMRKREMLLGVTLIGPHRDDLTISVNDRLAKTFASEGQKRCALAALRLGAWHRLHACNQSMPLMCIDDFGIHLDPQRAQLLQEQLHHLGQLFITSPTVLNLNMEAHHLFIQSGQISST